MDRPGHPRRSSLQWGSSLQRESSFFITSPNTTTGDGVQQSNHQLNTDYHDRPRFLPLPAQAAHGLGEGLFDGWLGMRSGNSLLPNGLEAGTAGWRRFVWWGPAQHSAVLLACQVLFLVGVPPPPEGGLSWVAPSSAASTWSRIKLGLLVVNTALAAAPIAQDLCPYCRTLAAGLGVASYPAFSSLAGRCLAAAAAATPVGLAFPAGVYDGIGPWTLFGMVAVIASASAGLSDVGRSGLMHLSFLLASTALAYIYPSGWLVTGISCGSLCPAIFAPPVRTVRGLQVVVTLGLIGFYAVLDAASRREGLAPSHAYLWFYSGITALQAIVWLRQVRLPLTPPLRLDHL